jgi:hypothetical protein
MKPLLAAPTLFAAGVRGELDEKDVRLAGSAVIPNVSYRVQFCASLFHGR